MGIPTSEVRYTSATTGRGVHEVHKRHVVALERNKNISVSLIILNLPSHITTGIYSVEQKETKIFRTKE
jgi:hypothetical protein